MRKLSAAFGALLLVAGLAACSSSGGDDSSSTTKAPSGGAATTTTGPDDEATTTTEADEETTTTSGQAAGGNAEAYAASLAKGLSSAEPDSGELVVSDDEAACVAPKWIDAIGVDALTSSGTSPDDLADPEFEFPDLGLSKAQSLDMVDAFVDCDVDIYEQFVEALGQGLDATQKACLEDGLDRATTREFLGAALTDPSLPSDLNAKLEAIGARCGLTGG